MSDKTSSDKRKRILIAAVKVFSEKGFHKAKVEEIAEAADVGKGTVYEYFKSKEEIFVEMLKAGHEIYTKKTLTHLKRATNAQEKLFKTIEIHFKFIEEHQNLARVMFKEHNEIKNLDEIAHKHRMGKVKFLEEVITEGVEKGEFKTQNPSITAALIFGMIGASSGMFIFAPQAPSIEQIINSMKDVLFNGILVK